MAGCTIPVLPGSLRGLEPEYPPARWAFWAGRPAYTDVDSLQPTLRWQSFPRQEDLDADPEGVLSRVSAVSYDLKIWKAMEGYPIRRIQREKSADPGELVYSRTGLPDPSHRVETPLEPSTRYFWTVRARFKTNGHSRVTEWGEQVLVAESPFTTHIVSYHRFETPSE